MKSCLLLFIIITTSTLAHAQDRPIMIMQDSTTIEPSSLRVIAEVVSADDNMAYLKIESVVGHGQGVISTLSEGDEVSVRLPGQHKPDLKTKIVADLLEKMDVGAMPTSYLLLRYKTIE